MNYVLPSVAYTRFVDAQTFKSSSCANACDVHGIILDRVFLGEETVHHLQLSVSGNCISYMLQWFR